VSGKLRVVFCDLEVLQRKVHLKPSHCDTHSALPTQNSVACLRQKLEAPVACTQKTKTGSQPAGQANDTPAQSATASTMWENAPTAGQGSASQSGRRSALTWRCFSCASQPWSGAPPPCRKRLPSLPQKVWSGTSGWT
jgi:hypothetical protein